jgi:AraC family transcriptional regulator, positive regulator of tynA and feaB
MRNFNAENFDNGLTPTLFKSLVNDRLYLMDYEVVANAECNMTRFNGIQLGAIDICRHDGFGLHRSVRRLHHIRADKVDDYLVHIPLSGSTCITQGGVSAKVEPGQFVIMTTATPSEGAIKAVSSSDLFSCYQARISASELRARVPLIDEYCDQSIRIRHGSGNMMLPLFDLALRDGNYLPEAQTRQLGAILIDMVANSIAEAPELDAGHGISPQSTPQRILEKAQAYIESHLSDPGLNIRQIADHCHVSVRTLQNIFASSGLKITAWILERRLLYCRAELNNPALRDKPVTRIAMTWGFNSPAYFSRVYKDRFDVTPSANRA